MFIIQDLIDQFATAWECSCPCIPLDPVKKVKSRTSSGVLLEPEIPHLLSIHSQIPAMLTYCVVETDCIQRKLWLAGKHMTICEKVHATSQGNGIHVESSDKPDSSAVIHVIVCLFSKE
jgi:hypothetical protein